MKTTNYTKKKSNGVEWVRGHIHTQTVIVICPDVFV